MSRLTNAAVACARTDSEALRKFGTLLFYSSKAGEWKCSRDASQTKYTSCIPSKYSVPSPTNEASTSTSTSALNITFTPSRLQLSGTVPIQWFARNTSPSVQSGHRCITYKALGAPISSKNLEPAGQGKLKSESLKIDVPAASNASVSNTTASDSSLTSDARHGAGGQEPEQDEETRKHEESIRTDWIHRILRWAVIFSVAVSFYLHAPAFYGPLGGQLALLGAENVHMRSTGLQRIALSITEARVLEFEESRGGVRLAELLRSEEDPSVRSEIYKTLVVLSQFDGTKELLLQAGILDLLESRLITDEEELKVLCSGAIKLLSREEKPVFA